MTMKLIQSQTLGSGAGSIQFNSIPQSFTDLAFYISTRCSTTGTSVEPCLLSFNGDAAGYVSRANSAAGGGLNNNATARIAFFAPRAGTTANSYGNAWLYIPNYTLAINKNYAADSVTPTDYETYAFGIWSNTAAITSVSFTPTANNFEAGSLVSLYGITKGTDGIVTTSP